MAILFVLCALSIAAYGTYRCRTPVFEDPLTECIAGNQTRWSQFIDGWGLLHFWFFAMLTFMYPLCWKEILLVGVLWELIEMSFKEHPFYLAKCDASVMENKAGWWYGRWEDIVMNSLGMVCGLAMRNVNAPGITFPVGYLVIVGFQFMLQSIRQRS